MVYTIRVNPVFKEEIIIAQRVNNVRSEIVLDRSECMNFMEGLLRVLGDDN